MAAIRHLRNAPITEALIDLRVIPRPGLDPSVFREAAKTLASRFPLVEERRDTEAMLQVVGGGKVSADMKDLGIQGLVFKSPDITRLVQFRRDGFTLNHLKPYQGWDVIFPEAMELWQLYEQLAKPMGITRIAVRYINRLEFPVSPIDMDDYCLTGPRFPEGVADDYSAWTSRIVLVKVSQRLNALVTQSLEQRLPTDLPSLLLDIDAFRVGEIEGGIEEIKAHFANLRQYKNEVFFGSLKDSYVERFK